MCKIYRLITESCRSESGIDITVSSNNIFILDDYRQKKQQQMIISNILKALTDSTFYYVEINSMKHCIQNGFN